MFFYIPEIFCFSYVLDGIEWKHWAEMGKLV